MSKLLVIQAARFGDLVQTKRLILGLGMRHQVHLAVDHNLVELAKLLYPLAIVHGLVFHGSLTPESLAANQQTFAILAAEEFQTVYNCNFSPLTSALCRIFPEERIVGYRPAHNSGAGLLRSHWARLAFRLASLRSITSLNLVDYWGWFAKSPVGPELVNPPASPGGGGLGVAVAGREERRSIPVEALAAACQTAFRQLQRPPIYLFGTVAENIRAKKLMRLFDGPMLKATQNLCGKTPWPELFNALAGLDLLITPDTGLMHLAAHLGVPTLCIFLSSAWLHETGPYGLGHRIFQAALPCAPCLEAIPCPHNLRCQKIFMRTDFMRCVSESLDRVLPLPWPDGLQLWQTGFDNLGARPILLRGHDAHDATRQAVRKIIKSYLHLPTDPDIPVDPALLLKLVPDSEWMLPPKRYC